MDRDPPGRGAGSALEVPSTRATWLLASVATVLVLAWPQPTAAVRVGLPLPPLPPASFTEESAVNVGDPRSVSGADDNAPESITHMVEVEQPDGSVGFYTADVVTSNPPLVDVAAVAEKVGGNAEARVSYQVRLNPKPDPLLPGFSIDFPNTPVPILATTSGSASVSGLAIESARAEFSFGGSSIEALACVSSCVPQPDFQEVTLESTLLPAASLVVTLQAATGVANGTASAMVIVDPRIEIDPEFTVLVEGVPTLATEVFELEFSEPVPEPSGRQLGFAALVALTLLRWRAGSVGCGVGADPIGSSRLGVHS